MSDFEKTFQSLYDLPLVVFRDDLDYLLQLGKSGKLKGKLGDAILINSSTTMPEFDSGQIVAFMWVNQSNHIDYYGFDYTHQQENGMLPVVVFAGHTIVQSWPSFHDFVQWLKCQ